VKTPADPKSCFIRTAAAFQQQKPTGDQKMKVGIRLVLSLALMTCAALADEISDKESKAVGAAREWLALCDQARYVESWEAAAVYFKNAAPKDQWEQAANAFRSPLGSLEKREVQSQKYQTSAPGAPDGEYVIIKFSTVFETKKEATETVTMMLEKDRGWRLCGYFIK
jgi:hypothetical protein